MNDIFQDAHNRLGIMQGRLSPKDPEKLQTFPHAYWELEFCRAAELGFKQIEWLVDSYDLSRNPLAWDDGIVKIKTLIAETGVQVKSLCAHFLIDGALTQSWESKTTGIAVTALNKLIDLASGIGIEKIVIPVMGSSSPGLSHEKWYQFKYRLSQIEKLSSCTLLLETDLPASSMLALLEFLACDHIGICYDMGNATALNFDVVSDFLTLVSYVREIHVKDRCKHGAGTYCLGSGQTPIREIVRQAIDNDYRGSFILETPVEDDWKRCAHANLNFMRSIGEHLL